MAYINVGAGFDDGLSQPKNTAERVLLESMVAAAALIAGGSTDILAQRAIVDEICLDGDARGIHRFEARHFRDFVREQLAEEPVSADPIDHASNLIGLGWKVRGRDGPPEVSGVSGCTSYLNDAVSILLNEICEDLKRIDRRQFIHALLHNHETAASHRGHWRRTSRALLAMRRDKESALRTIVEHNAELNACSIASRILMEAAICECPLESGERPGRLELSRMIAKIMTVFQFGGWSDAIYWGAMEPRLKITPLGDIHANVSFMQTVYEPFGRNEARTHTERAVEAYDELYRPMLTQTSVASSFEAGFLSAWEAEFGISVDGMRAFAGKLEDLALQEQAVFIELERSRLAGVLSESARLSHTQALLALEFQTSASRPEWRVVSEGFASKDWYPWRFRRRLAILRRPFIQIDASNDPVVICAPGLILDSFRSMLAWFHKGEISQARSREMAKWLGHTNDVHRLAFNETVANEMRRLGWQVRKEVRLTHILGRPLDRDYGDIDVLAWNPNAGRVLAIECKDLQAHTTFGEVAEELNDFRGETLRNGKPDHLKRHLDRVAILVAKQAAVAKFLALSFSIKIEGHLVFKNSVPMRFAWDAMASRIKLSLFKELPHI